MPGRIRIGLRRIYVPVDRVTAMPIDAVRQSALVIQAVDVPIGLYIYSSVFSVMSHHRGMEVRGSAEVVSSVVSAVGHDKIVGEHLT